MAGITLAEAQARLAAYLAAEEAVLTGQKYEINGRMLQRANLDQIQAGITLWNQRVQQLSARASGRTVSITPRPIF